MERPETRYAWNGDVSLAYQVMGDGPTDLLYLQGYCSQVDMNWESPHLGHFLRGLARHARLIVTDRRGWGCSERFSPGYVPDVDTLTDDVLAVPAAVGSDRASILATYESTIVASLFAAVYPDRTRSLILVDPQVTYLPTDETPWMPTLARWQEQIRLVRDTWGTLDWWDSPQGPEAEWFSRYARASATPGGLAAELSNYLETDIRDEEASFDRVLATVLFTDIVESTQRAAELGDRRWRERVERHHSTVRTLLARYRGKEVDTAGDGFFASFDGPARAVRCAVAIVEAARPLGIEIRAGVHIGEVEVIDHKVGGLAVSIGSRVAGVADPSEVLVSQTVKDLVAGSGLTLRERGVHRFKGVPDEWRVYAVDRE